MEPITLKELEAKLSLGDYNKHFSGDLSTSLPDVHNTIKNQIGEAKYYAVKDYQVNIATTYNKSLIINYVSLVTKNLVFVNCNWIGGVVISNLDNIDSITFIDCEFEEIYFSNPASNIHFVECRFQKDFEIYGNSSFEGKQLDFYKCSFNKNVLFKDIRNPSLIKFHGVGSEIKGDFMMSKFSCSQLVLSNLKVEGQIEFSSNQSITGSGSISKGKIGQASFKSCNWSKADFNGFQFIEEVKIENISFEQLSFNGCVFERIKVDEKFSGEECSFNDCELKKIQFENLASNSEQKLLFNKTKLSQLTFFNTKSFGMLFCNEEFKANEILITQEGTSDSKFEFLNLQGDIETLNIYQSEIAKMFINNGVKDLILIKSVVGKLRCTSEGEKTVKLRDNQFIDEVEFSKGSFGFFEMEENVFEKGVKVEWSTFQNPLEFKKCFNIQKLQFKSSTLNDLSITGGALGELVIDKGSELGSRRVIFSKTSIGHFTPLEKAGISYYFSNALINQTTLENDSLSKESTISFNDSKLNYFKIKHYNVYGNMYFRNCKSDVSYSYDGIEETELSNKGISILRNDSSSYWKKIKQPTLDLSYSSLGETEFIEFSFEDFLFKFNNTKLIDSFIAGSQFPEEIEISEIIKEDRPKEYHNQKVLVYNQLKKIAERSGDVVKASLMHSNALQSQHEVLKKTDNKRTERFVFFANKWSNKHGESWTRAFWFTLCSTLLLFSIYTIIEGNYGIQGDFDSEIISDYIKFIDPFRKDNFTESWDSNLMYFLNKVVFSYGIFQLVTAFRRHGKK